MSGTCRTSYASVCPLFWRRLPSSARSFSSKSSRKLLIVSFVLIFLFAAGFSHDAICQPMTLPHFTDYMYLTNLEVTVFEEIIWFWTPDSMDGPVHSNDYIGIKYSPCFLDRISTSQSDFIEFAPSPYFEYPPLFNAPVVEFDTLLANMENYCRAAEDAGTWFGGDSTLQGRLVASEDGWILERWLEGVPYDSAIVVESFTIPYDNEHYENWSLIYNVGNLELSGEFVEGKTIIVTTGTIYLSDNICYMDVPADSFNSSREPMPDTEHMLNIMAGENIIVADTWENGRGNGVDIGPTDYHARKHIVITAALQAVSGSFTFEHHNDTWDEYRWCDPEGDNADSPDERGTVWLRGALTQYRKHYLHRSNCGGTGYHKDFRYDIRFQDCPPPGLFTSRPTQLILEDSTITIDDTYEPHQWGSIYLGPGARVEFINGNRISLEYLSELTIVGTPDNPAEIVVNDEEGLPPFTGDPDDFARCDSWENADFYLNGGDIWTPAIVKKASVFTNGNSLWQFTDLDQTAVLDSCYLVGQFTLASVNDGSRLEILHTIINGRIISNEESRIDHSIFFSRVEDENSIALFVSAPATVRNSFFLGNYHHAFDGNVNDLFISYSGFDGTLTANPFGPHVNPGMGNIEADPLFVNAVLGDFHLQADSPLIDAGDPESPLDPDGTITDIGVFYYDQDLTEVQEELAEAIPSDFKISGPFPNPFNSSAIIELELNKPGKVKVDMYDTLGRYVKPLYNRHQSAGVTLLRIDGNGLSTGMYFLSVAAGSKSELRKMMLIK